MNSAYHPTQIEAAAQAEWTAKNVYRVTENAVEFQTFLGGTGLGGASGGRGGRSGAARRFNGGRRDGFFTSVNHGSILFLRVGCVRSHRHKLAC